MTGWVSWAVWAGLIVLFSLGVTLVAQPRYEGEVFWGLVATLDAVALGIWWLRRSNRKTVGEPN